MSKSATITIINETKAKIDGLDSYDLTQLYNKYAIFAKNYFFSPKYKLKQWDGKINFFTSQGHVSALLLEDIVPFLVQQQYSLEVVDNRVPPKKWPKPIDKDVFNHILHAKTKKPTELRYYQVDAVNSLIEGSNGILLASTGAGKAQPLTAKILSPSGWVAMGDIKVGDKLLTPKGQETTVQGIYPQGQKDIYQITFHDGSSTLCCKEHLWEVYMPTADRKYSAKTSAQVVNLETMMKFMADKSKNNWPGNISIDTIDIFEYADVPNLPVDPYLIGALLGDGCLSRKNAISFTSADETTVDRVSRAVEPFEVTLKHKSGFDYNITKTIRTNKPNLLVTALANLNLMKCTAKDKFIPPIYKTASLSDRISLIQGLFDTDGTVDLRGHISFTTVSKQLATDVQDMLWALGCTCTITSKRPSYSYKNVSKLGQLAYTLYVSTKMHGSTFFSLDRKKSRCKQFDNRRTLRRRVKSITYHSNQLAQCIMVDDPEHLYVTDDYIVTHNTLITAAMAYSFNEVDMRTLIIVPDESLARQTAEEMLHYELDTGLYIGKVKDTEHTNIVATWQSLKNLPAYIKEFDCVIVDETHGARGPILKNLLIEYATNVPFRYGLTGTLPEDPCDKMQVHSALGPIRYEIPAHKLIDEGILATINIDVIELTEDFTDEYKQFVELELNGDSSIISYSEFVDEYFADYDAERSFLRKSPLRNEWISNLIIDCQDQPKGNVLVITDSVALTRILGDLIPGSYVVNGQDVAKAADRKVIYKEFDTRNDVVMIATSKLCSTGIDIPRIHYVIMIDLGKSFIKIIQTIGRGARKADDKDSIKAIDISSNLKYAKKHVKERIKHYKNAKYPFKKFSIDYVKQIKMEDNDNVII